MTYQFQGQKTTLEQIRNSKQRKKGSKDVHTLCPTRWTVRRDALAAFIENYTELMDLWDWSLQATSGTEMKAMDVKVGKKGC